MFNWGEAQELIDRNPARRMKAPRYTPRDVRIPPEDWATLLAGMTDDDPFKVFLLALRATGARPFEVRTVEARHVAGRTWTFEVKESKGKRRRRAVPLNDAAYAITQALAEKHPKGPLFRNKKGKPWTAYSINCRLRRLAEKTGVKITAYAIRHEFVSAAIETGKVDLVSLANIVGHADLTMLKKVYSHLEANSPHLQKMVKEATGEATHE
jgi:integrase